jgi:hypothetical protein
MRWSQLWSTTQQTVLVSHQYSLCIDHAQQDCTLISNGLTIEQISFDQIPPFTSTFSDDCVCWAQYMITHFHS